MESLLKDLLAYSRAGSEGRDVQDEVSESEAALNEALANLSALIKENQAQITRTQMPLVRMPRVHLVQIFQNLIGNALKYRDVAKPPQIHVDAQPHDGTWIFSVKDNGMGIEPQYQAQIFRIFGRLHNHEVPGTGIGLALCKKLVERSGGSIWVESTPGQGSAFYFTVRP
jgi:light-regulated signal transduction histidine kinase (bacteriophytochrome)